MTTALDTARPTAPVGSPAIVARDLTKRFGDVTAVDGLSFEVLPGRVTGLAGAHPARPLRVLSPSPMPPASATT